MAGLVTTEELLVQQMTQLTEHYTEKALLIDSLRQEFNTKKPAFDAFVTSIKTLSNEADTLKERANHLEAMQLTAQKELDELKESVTETHNLNESSLQDKYSSFFATMQSIRENYMQIQECIENGRMVQFFEQEKAQKSH